MALSPGLRQASDSSDGYNSEGGDSCLRRGYFMNGKQIPQQPLPLSHDTD